MLLLSIVKLDHSINQLNDPPVIDTINRVIDHLSCSTPPNNADGILSSSNDDNELLQAKVIKSIVRYRRNIDKWTSFTSLLLKSIAYYRSSIDHLHNIGITSSLKSNDDIDTHHMNKLQIKEKKRPIVDLPRTKYNRPYIPIQILDKDTSEVVSSSSCCHPPPDIAKLQTDDKVTINENYNSMMNISHQYPWVSMIQQQQLSPSKDETPILIGLDIVTFDPHINDYTPTISNFLSNFQGSFTSYEWDRITNYTHHQTSSIPSRLKFGKKQKQQPRNEQSQLQEFYLRWSIKESYTKAIGLGMNINFHEFETILIGIDDIDKNASVKQDDDEGIWSTIMRQDGTNTNDTTTTTTTTRRKIGDVQLSIIGKVKHIKSSSKPHCEYWEFIFIPLNDDSSHTQTVSDSITSDVSYNGCACICRGPIAKDDIKKSSGSMTKEKVVSIEELTMVDLIELHGSSPL